MIKHPMKKRPAKQASPLPIEPNAVYLTHEAAALCRCQPCTIREAVRTGKISGKGRPFRILGSELLKFLS